MYRRALKYFSATLAFAVVTLPVWARPESLKSTIVVSSPLKVGSSTLAPGHYDVIAEGNQAKFEHGGKVVAEVSYTLKTLPSKAHGDEFIVDHDQITEIQFAGKTQAIDF